VFVSYLEAVSSSDITSRERFYLRLLFHFGLPLTDTDQLTTDGIYWGDEKRS